MESNGSDPTRDIVCNSEQIVVRDKGTPSEYSNSSTNGGVWASMLDNDQTDSRSTWGDPFKAPRGPSFFPNVKDFFPTFNSNPL